MRKFRALHEPAIPGLLQTFSHAVRERLENAPLFGLLPVPKIERRPLTEAGNWDRLQTIFPFLLCHPATIAGRMPLRRSETAQVYQWLQADLSQDTACKFTGLDIALASMRCQLGRPVAYGSRDGMEVSVLRICASARMIVDALAPDGKGAAAVIKDALTALDKTAWLIKSGF